MGPFQCNSTPDLFINAALSIFSFLSHLSYATQFFLNAHNSIEMRPSEVRKYRLFVSYRRRGYSLRTIEALPSDPDCSLMLSYCHLRDLVPGQAYRSDRNRDKTPIVYKIRLYSTSVPVMQFNRRKLFTLFTCLFYLIIRYAIHAKTSHKPKLRLIKEGIGSKAVLGQQKA